jgi:hypothetical protein
LEEEQVLLVTVVIQLLEVLYHLEVVVAVIIEVTDTWVAQVVVVTVCMLELT